MDYPGKDAFLRHNALSHLAAYGASGVTLFANLGHLQEDFITNPDARTDGPGDQVYFPGGDIFREITGTEVEAQPAHFVDTFHRQQAYLTVRRAVSVGVANHAEVFLNHDFGHRFFLDALFLTDANGYYCRHM
jgi:hypothetical protein